MNKELTMAKTSLPVGWEMKTLGEVCVKTETVNPKTNPEKEFIYLDVSSVNKETKLIEATTTLLGKDAPSRARKLVKKDDVIFATVRPTHSRVALIPEDYNEQVCSTGYYVLRAKPIIENQFIFYYLLTDFFNELMESMQKGASYPAVTNKEVESVKIPLPPLPQQKQIVAILDKAFAAIDTAKANAEQNLKNAKELFESYLQNVFENKGDDWEEKTLGKLCERVSVGYVGPTSKFYCDPSIGVPFIRSQNVRSGYLDWKGIQHVTKEFHNSVKKSQLKIEDILFVRVGAKRGDCCVLKEDIKELNCANIVFARLKTGNVDFIDRFCQSSVGKKQLLGMSVGAAQGVINTKSVAGLIIPYPPLSIQQTIVQKANALSVETKKLEAIYTQKIDDLEEMKKSVLQKAFSGQLNTIN
jgi:type I restriction enzyme S subunit